MLVYVRKNIFHQVQYTNSNKVQVMTINIHIKQSANKIFKTTLKLFI